MRGADPITLMKAVKNAAEIAGARAAHRATARRWRTSSPGSTARRRRESSPRSTRSRRWRPSAATPGAEGVSFPTISGAGPNGAIVHYRVTRATNRKIAPGELFLVDSGAQYEDGTTDITRTIAVGTPTAEMRDRFTRVLKGHIAIARAVFPRRHHRRAARSRSRASTSGPPASISITAPATASAAICRCTRARRASPSSAPRRSSAA